MDGDFKPILVIPLPEHHQGRCRERSSSRSNFLGVNMNGRSGIPGVEITFTDGVTLGLVEEAEAEVG